MSQAVRAGRAEVDVSLRDRIAEAVPQLEAKLKATGAKLAKIGAVVTAGMTAAGPGIFGFAAKSFAAAGKTISDMSVSTGVAVQTLGELEYAAVRTGASMEDVKTIITAIREGKALELWGSTSAGVLRMLKADVLGLTREARQMQVALSDQDVSSALELNKAFSTGAYILKGLWQAIGSAVAPAATEASRQLTNMVTPLISLIKNNRELVRTLFAATSVVAVVSSTLAALGGIIAGAATALGFLSGAFWPLMAGAAILTAVAVAAYQFRDELRDALSSVANSIRPLIDGVQQVWAVFSKTFGGIIMALGSGQLEAAANIAWLGMVAVAWTAVAGIAEAINAGIAQLTNWFPALNTLGEYFSSTFGSIMQALLAGNWELAGQIIMTKLTMGWLEGIDLLKDALDGMTAWVISTYRGMIDTLTDMLAGFGQWQAKLFGRAAERLGLVENGEQIMGNLAQQDNERRAAKRTERDMVDPFEIAQEGIMEREQARKAQAQRLAQMEQQAGVEFKAAGSPTIASASATLAAQANARLDAAIEAAKKAAAAKGGDAPTLDLPGGGKGDSDDGKLDSRGTFSAVAATILGAGGDAQKETATNTRLMTKQLGKIADNTAAAGDVK
jgi:hypothetical protein